MQWCACNLSNVNKAVCNEWFLCPYVPDWNLKSGRNLDCLWWLEVDGCLKQKQFINLMAIFWLPKDQNLPPETTCTALLFLDVESCQGHDWQRKNSLWGFWCSFYFVLLHFSNYGSPSPNEIVLGRLCRLGDNRHMSMETSEAEWCM